VRKTWVFVVGLIALFLVPTGGNPTVFAVMEKVSARLAQPVTAEEQAQLDLLECIKVTASAIPDLARVEKVLPQEDSYLVQRVGDIMYPRIRFDIESPQYRLYVNSDPGSAELTSSAMCAQYFVGVEKLD
jgi:hypothetical protein